MNRTVWAWKIWKDSSDQWVFGNWWNFMNYPRRWSTPQSCWLPFDEWLSLGRGPRPRERVLGAMSEPCRRDWRRALSDGQIRGKKWSSARWHRVPWIIWWSSSGGNKEKWRNDLYKLHMKLQPEELDVGRWTPTFAFCKGGLESGV